MRSANNLTFRTQIDPKTGHEKTDAGLKKVFLSYKKSDNEITDVRTRLVNKILSIVDCAVWYDENLTGGKEFGKEIADAIATCEIMILLLTKNILESDYVWDVEVPQAKELNKPIIPIAYGITEKERKIAERLMGAHLQIIDMPPLKSEEEMRNSDEQDPDDTEFMRKLVNTLNTFIVNSDINQRTRNFFSSNGHLISPSRLSLQERYDMGYGYLKGIGIEVDEEKGIKILDTVINFYSDDEESMKLRIDAAVLLFNYYYDIKQYEDAVRYASYGKEFNSGYLINKLGVMYYYGHGVSKNYRLAMQHYEKAAELDTPNAMRNLALLHGFDSEIKNIGSSVKDIKKARSYLEQAIKYDHLDSVNTYILLIKNSYKFGEEYSDDDAQKLLELYRKGASLGDGTDAWFAAELYKKRGQKKEAEKYYLKAAELQNSKETSFPILYLMRLLYMGGSKKKAVELFRQSADNGLDKAGDMLTLLNTVKNANDTEYLGELVRLIENCSDARFLIIAGNCYFSGTGVEQNNAKAEQLYQKAEIYADTTALFQLAELYYEGKNAEKNTDKANALYSKIENDAIVKENRSTLIKLGKKYFKGDLCEENKSKAIELYRHAAESGSYSYLLELADMFCKGEYAAVDTAYADMLYEKAAEKAAEASSAYALTSVADRYLKGDGIYQSSERAVRIYEIAAEKANFPLLIKIAETLYDGVGDIRNPELVERIYRKAESIANASELFDLARRYADGNKVETDFSRAFEIYKKSAELGNPASMCNLGYYYETGKGTAADRDKALQWYTKSAEAGGAHAMRNLGLMYKKGEWVEKDLDKAEDYFVRSAEKGNTSVLGCIIDTLKQYNAEGLSDRYYNLLDKTIEYFAKAEVNINSTANNSFREYTLYNVLEKYDNDSEEYRTLSQKAISALKDMAEAGNAGAMDAIRHLANTIGFFRNDAKTEFELTSYCAELGHLPSLYRTAELLLYGKGTPADPQKAREYLELAAENKHTDAYVTLGNIYRDGIGVEKNLNTAENYYWKAAEEDNFDGKSKLRSLAESYYEDNKIQRAERILNMLAEKNDPYAESMLGDINMDSGNFAKALEWYKKSSEGGNQSAYMKLAEMYRYGTGVEKNEDKAIEYYKLGSKSTSGGIRTEDHFKAADEISRMGFEYWQGITVDQDFEKAAKYYEIAYQCGSAIGTYNLGVLYRDGQGVEQDLDKAVELFTRAASSINMDKRAVDNIAGIGHMYYTGQGNGYEVEINYDKAVELFKLAEKHGSNLALVGLGVAYREGKGVERDYTKAMEYFKLADEKGISLAKVSIANMYRCGHGVEVDYKKAFELLNQAAEENIPEAYLEISNMYMLGQGVEQSTEKYYEYIQKAADLGSKNAAMALKGKEMVSLFIDDDDLGLTSSGIEDFMQNTFSDMFEISARNDSVSQSENAALLFEKTYKFIDKSSKKAKRKKMLKRLFIILCSVLLAAVAITAILHFTNVIDIIKLLFNM